MKNRGILFVFILALLSINFVTASFHYGGYSLSDVLNTFDSSTVILTSIFLISFILIFWPLSKFFRENPMLAGIISFAMSFLLIFEINRRGYNFAGFFYNIGISEGILSTIIPLVLIIVLIFSGFKYGWGITLTSIGGFFIIISFTEIIYAKGITFILGAILLGIGIWLWRRRRKRRFVDPYYQNYDTYSGPSQRQIYKQQKVQQIEPRRKQQIQQRQRTQRELQGKYNQYRFAAESIVKKKGHIPKKGTLEYREWKRYTQTVKTIEKMASKQGFRLK